MSIEYCRWVISTLRVSSGDTLTFCDLSKVPLYSTAYPLVSTREICTAGGLLQGSTVMSTPNRLARVGTHRTPVHCWFVEQLSCSAATDWASAENCCSERQAQSLVFRGTATFGTATTPLTVACKQHKCIKGNQRRFTYLLSIVCPLTLKKRFLLSLWMDTATAPLFSVYKDDCVTFLVVLLTVSCTTTGSWHLKTTMEPPPGHCSPLQLPHGRHEPTLSKDWHCSWLGCCPASSMHRRRGVH